MEKSKKNLQLITYYLLLATYFLPLSLFAGFNQLNDNGFGNVNNLDASAMAVFSNKLYVGTENWDSRSEIWRTSNGYDWQCVATNGFDWMSDDRICSFCIFSNYLYAGSGWNGQVWRTADGTNWNKVNIDGFGNWNNDDIVLIYFNGWLYAGTYNYSSGSEIWRSSNGTNWQSVSNATNGFGNTNNIAVRAFAVFSNRLYAGTENWDTGNEIWRSPDGINWTNVSSNGWGTGDGRINSMLVFNGYLYAGSDEGKVYRSANGTSWNQITGNGFGSYGSIVSFAIYSNYIHSGLRWGMSGGCRLYRSATGDAGTWSQVNQNGFGNPNNDGLQSMAVFSNSLFCGTYNYTEGCEIWSDLTLDINLVKNADAPGGNVFQGSNNVTVLAFSLWDSQAHTITNLRLSNLGSMSNNIDVTNVKLWFDVNGNFLYNPGDVQIDIAQWNNSTKTWDFTGLNLTGKTNYIITIDIAETAVNERTFIGYMKRGFIRCNGGAENVTKLKNKNLIAVGPHYVQIIKNVNIPSTNIGGNYQEEALAFRIKDTGYHKVTKIRVRNSGTMQSNIDVWDLWLWYDNVNIGHMDWGQDTWITALQWNSQEACWSGLWQPFDSMRDLLLILPTTANGIPGRTFIANIGIGDITLSCGSTNTNSIQNANAITRIDEVVPSKLTNITSCTVSINSNNITVMAFEITNRLYWRWTRDIRISNNGTMENNIDVVAVKLWQDNGSIPKQWDSSDTQINGNGVWNPTNQSWDFLNIGQSSGQDIIVTIDVGSMGRNGKTFIARIKKGDVANSYSVLNNIAITNYGSITIAEASHWVFAKTNQIVDYYNYTVKAGWTNKPVLSFKFLDSTGTHYLKYLRISNLGTMTGGDITAVKAWKDLGTIGYYDKGIDIFAGYLGLNNISDWTNNNLSIGESTNVLITIDTSPGIANGKTFRACTILTNDISCNEGKSSMNCITNVKTLVSDIIPPTAVSIKELFSGTDLIRLEWSSCTDSDCFDEYKIAYDTSSHATWQDYAFKTNASTTNITITGLNPNTTYYFRVCALDGAFNEGTPSTEANKKTKQVNLLTLYQVNQDGFGNSGNSSPSDMEVFKNKLYLGCSYYSTQPVARVFRTSLGTNWKQVNTDGFGDDNNYYTLSFAVFNNYIYASTYNLNNGAQIWRSADGTNWSSVMSGGFGDADNFAILKMFVWNGYIYAGTRKDTGGAELWRSADGLSWSQVNSDGFGNQNNTRISGIGSFGSYLYVGTYQDPNVSGGEIYRSLNGTSWESVSAATNGFSDINNEGIIGFTEFGGWFYSTTMNEKNGCEIWRTSNGTTWVQVENGGFGNTGNTTIYEITVYSNQLLLGTSKEFGVPSPCQLWSSSDGTNWIKRSQDNIGDINNLGIIGLSTFENGLFFNVRNNTTGLKVFSDKPYVQTCGVGVVKIADTPAGNVTPNSSNIPVLCFKATDTMNHKISTIKISKNGTMAQGTDISDVKLWYDVNKNNTWDTGDTYIATGIWSPVESSWNFTSLSVFSSSNLITTINIASTAVQGRTFQARIDTGDVICENGSQSTNSIINANTLIIKRVADNFDNVKIYPIPLYNGEELKIDNLTERARISIFTISGKLVKKYEASGIFRILVDELNISSGMYIVVFSADGVETVTRKFIYINKKR